MTELQQTLINRFGEHRVLEIQTLEGEMPLLALDLEVRSQVTVICTNGLSNYEMPVPEKMSERKFNELCFCLPSYWEWENMEDPRMNWIFPWIQKLAKHVVEKNTWYGHGHTFASGPDLGPLSPTMLQNHLMLSEPMLLEEQLRPIKIGNKNVYFLTIIPIFSDEMDFKQSKGTYKLIQKMRDKGVDELLDDFRKTSLRSKWRIF